mmetsp:Transcript_13706/g.15739  ORF Transcript_13706/g.15739 Transcript_13706/m.15739 type:complete len:84 (+) Transcript_13706:1-252(+)
MLIINPPETKLRIPIKSNTAVYPKKLDSTRLMLDPTIAARANADHSAAKIFGPEIIPNSCPHAPGARTKLPPKQKNTVCVANA